MRSSEFLNEADPANPYTGKDPVKAAAWAKLSPQVQKKLGGADPTDPYIIARMTKGELGGLFGGGATDAKKTRQGLLCITCCYYCSIKGGSKKTG